jgi:hypothetical protein
MDWQSYQPNQMLEESKSLSFNSAKNSLVDCEDWMFGPAHWTLPRSSIVVKTKCLY